MVGKLLKYEFIRTRGALALSGLAVLLVCLVGYGLSFVSPTIAAVPFFIGFVLAVAFTFGIQIYLAVEFHQSSFGRRGYLTHALPVKPSTLVLTKLLYALLVCVVAVAWSVGMLMISLLTAQELGFLTWEGFWAGFREAFGVVPWFIGFLLLNMLGTVLVTMVMYFFSVAVGNEAWINKAGRLGPVLVLVLTYVAFQILMMVSFLVPPSFNPVTETLSWNVPLVDMIRDMDTAGIPLSAFWFSYLFAPVLVWWSVRSVSRKLELR